MPNNYVAIQNSLSAGEISPSLLGRVDVEKYHSGCSTIRNFFANYKGGISSRPGLAYVGTCKQPGTSAPPRDIPFQFNIFQGYVLEFGEFYMRIKYNGAYVTETPIVVQGVSGFALIETLGPHGFSVGDWVYNTGNPGFTGLTWIVDTVVSPTGFTVKDLFGQIISSATVSGLGTIARVYTVDSPYAAADLSYLKYIQSADTMTLTCVNADSDTEYPPYNLVRSGHTHWTFTVVTFSSSVTAPTGLTATARSSNVPTTWYSYVVTGISSTGEESNPSLPCYIQNNDLSINAGSNILTWTGVSGVVSYNIYAATPSYSQNITTASSYGFIGISRGPSYTDTNIVPDFTVPPPSHTNPFERGAVTFVNVTAGGTNYSQSTVGYSITTSTGSSFAGVPVVQNGALAGFVIYNHGKGYLTGDTITITDSGGGLATGTLTFTSQPVDGDQVSINGCNVTFRTAPFSGMVQSSSSSTVYSEIDGTVALTVQSLANNLNSASNVLSLAVATYTASGSVLTVTYNTPGATGNSYTLPNSAHWTRSAATLAGGGTAGASATATLSIGSQSGTYPSVSSYFQSRRVYASSLNSPDTYWMSQPGLFNNMDTNIPVIDSDAVTGTPWAQQINGIQFMVAMPGGLVLLTGKGAWQLNGGNSAAITPSDQNAVPQAYNGCDPHVPPLIINYDILYVQAKGSIVRDLSYNFFVNIYTGTDITILSNHLFIGKQIRQWCYAEEPYKLVWAIRDDGVLLSLTYLKEQEVSAWTRHDTNGLFVSVCSVTEPVNSLMTITPTLTDAVYVITRRYVQGGWRYYSERFDNRLWTDAESSFCVDSGLSNALTYPNAGLFPSASTGENVLFVTDNPVFSSGDVGKILRAGGGIATVVSYVTSTSVYCDITQDITEVVPNNPNNLPAPINVYEWSLTTPVTVLSKLNHLEGLTVSIVADGSVVDNQVVVNGSVTLPQEASRIVVGLPFTCQAQTLYLDHPDGANTIQNRRKDVSAVGLRVEASRGLQIGADQPDQSFQQNNETIPWTNMTEIKERTNQVYAGNSVPLYTGDYYQAVTSSWSLKGQVAVQQSYPLPANILSVISYFTMGDNK